VTIHGREVESMTLYICNAGNGREYSAATDKAGEPCIHCGKGPLEIVGPEPEIVTITMDKQAAASLLLKLKRLADDAEDDYRHAQKVGNIYLGQYELAMRENKYLYTAFQAALHDAEKGESDG